MPPSTQPFIHQPPRDLSRWVQLFEVMQLPVLASTAAELELLRENEDAVDANMLAEVIAMDPLMTLKLLAHVAHLRRGRDGSEPETVTAALVMLGISPFFNVFGDQPTIEDHLAELPTALAGFKEVLLRARRAASFAIGFAVHRMDYDAPVIHEAALLHDFAELLLWLRAPQLAQQIVDRKAADPSLRSNAIQKELLNIELDQLEHALMLHWRLPALLVQITDEHAAVPGLQVRNVQLAIRLARHSAQGWDNPALPDDIADLSQLLSISPEAVQRLVLEIDAECQS
jgi:HD-like signal output (HDOD) protein